MFQFLVLNAALSMGQAPMPAVRAMPAVGGAEVIKVAPVADDKKAGDCKTAPVVVHESGCCDKKECTVILLKPWKCEDLECKPCEKKDGCRSFLNCPKEEKKCDEEEPACDEDNDGPLMQWIKCRRPERCANAPKIYGWIQQGFTANVDSPNDRYNFGVNMNFRSNDYQLNQAYLVIEKALEHEGKFNIGYRIDALVGTDVAVIAANGLLDRTTGRDPTSGLGIDGPNSFRQAGPIGLDLPQFYVEAHLPVLTERGVDIKAGKFYTLMGMEVIPAPSTNFYSHSYEAIYAVPFTHTGVMATFHLTDTIDLYQGVVQGWDAFEDNNSAFSYHGMLTWTSCDKKTVVGLHYITGPEQPDNNSNQRTVVAGNINRTFGDCDQWRVFAGGHLGWEENAAAGGADAEWYGATANLFYTVDPPLVLGVRGEWFRDDDATRTALLRRPGFAANFYEITAGATYKPFQNLRLRPEVRFDWTPDNFAPGARPYNDLQDDFQTTIAIDAIWEF